MDPVVLLLVNGNWLGWAACAAAAGLSAALAPKAVERWRNFSAAQRRSALGEACRFDELASGRRGVTLEGRVRVLGSAAQRHDDGASVAVSTATAGRWVGAAAGTGIEVECEGGAVRLSGVPRVRVGSEELVLSGVRAAVTSGRRSLPWRRVVVRSVADGDAVLVHGDVTALDERSAELGGEIALASSAPPRVTPPTSRLRFGLWGLAVSAALLTGSGRAAAGVADSKLPFLGLRLAAASFAAASPWRGRGLEAARKVIEIQVVLPLPETEERLGAQHGVPPFSDPVKLDPVPLRRFLTLAEQTGDCDEAPRFLSGAGGVYCELSMPLAGIAERCKQPWLLSDIAEARYREGQFELASSLYEKAALVWGETDRDQPGAGIYAGALASNHLRGEVLAHVLAGRFDAAARALQRNPSLRSQHLACAALVFRDLAGDAGARDSLRAERGNIGCALMLAKLESGPARSELLKKLPAESTDPNISTFELAAVVLEEMATSGYESSAYWHEALPWRVESPHQLLGFPHGAKPTDPALVLALVERFEKVKDPSPAQRTARARLASSAAAFSSLIAEHAHARRYVELAERDYEALFSHFSDLGKAQQYSADEAALDAELTRGLHVGIELRAGDLARAKSLAASLGQRLPKNDEPWIKRARASLHLIRAFVALFEGDTDPMATFVPSAECEELSSCFVVQRDLPALLAAARGQTSGLDVDSAPTVGLLAAHRAKAGDELRAKLGNDFTLLGIADAPIDQLYRAGEHATLAEALGDAQEALRFRKAAELLRPVALDPKLVFALLALGELR